MRTLTAVVFLLIAAPAVSAGIIMDSLLQGDLGTLSLRAEAEWDGTSWLYQYTLGCDSIGDRAVHVFTLDNPAQSAYFDAANNAGFSNPALPELAFLEWRNVVNGLVEGQTATFSFRSLFEPAQTPVFVLVVNGGTAAWGETLGMSDRLPGCQNVIPEAGSLSLGAVGLAAVAAGRRRSRS